MTIGVGRQLESIFGTSKYRGMDGKKLSSVKLSDDKEEITFTFDDGFEAVFGVEGDCCSHSWIEHLEAPDDVSGKTLETVSDYGYKEKDLDNYGGLRQFYQTKFVLSSGETISIEYRNDSNGHYGGYLVRIR